MHYGGWNFRGMPNRSRKEDLMNREMNQLPDIRQQF
jgi:hypothetical protein